MGQDIGANTASALPVAADRVEWLDGVRALAALFVVLHHAWLMTVGGYPGNNGPWFTDWLIYGHLAVSVFIVVSGFSLTLSVSKRGMLLKEGARGFLRRRFWRIVPPYWASLVLVALLIAAGWTGPANGPEFRLRDFLVHFLLVQDAVGNVSPNGVFWSIAVEWHIYFLFPLIVVCFRKYGIKIVLPAVAALVIAQQLLGHVVPLVGQFDRFTPAYLVLFVVGSAAAWLVRRGQGARAGAAVAALLGTAVLTYMVLAGSQRTTSAYFWVDLVVGLATAALFVALAQGRVQWLARIISIRPLAFVGSFAFSLYLIHAPILAMITTYVVKLSPLPDDSAFGLLLLIGVPASLGAAYVFFLLCERPFLKIRSFPELVTALQLSFRRKGIGGHRPVPVVARDPGGKRR